MFERLLNVLNGIKGYLAIFFSLKKNKTPITQLNTMRQMTFGEFHGKMTPPKSRPRSNMSTKPRTDALPAQSMALNPSSAFVFGLCTSKNTRSKTKVVPVQ